MTRPSAYAPTCFFENLGDLLTRHRPSKVTALNLRNAHGADPVQLISSFDP
jgi:hypothetical protein